MNNDEDTIHFNIDFFLCLYFIICDDQHNDLDKMQMEKKKSSTGFLSSVLFFLFRNFNFIINNNKINIKRKNIRKRKNRQVVLQGKRN